MIPLCDPQAENASLQGDIEAAVRDVLDSGQYILGPQLRAFEQEMAAYLGCRYAVGVGNGTDALHLVLRALDIGPGDEVITTPFTFIATSEAIGLVGATPVFVDIDPHTFNIDPQLVAGAVTPRTKAILPVHLFGQPCDMQALAEIAGRHNLHVIEDCAQALGAAYRGAKTATLGTAGCLSFFPSKNLGCCGDGGMVVTNDAAVYERVEVLRRHGGRRKYHHSELGLNSRLDELQAAVLRVKLPHLDRWNQQRRERARVYNRLLGQAPELTCPAELADHGRRIVLGRDAADNETLQAVYHQYTIQLADRERVAAALRETGIACFPYYPLPLHLQEVHAQLGYRAGDFPQAEQVAGRCLSLPMFPALTEAQQTTVAQRLQGLFQRACA